MVEIADLALDAGEGAEQVEPWPLAVEIFEQGEDGLFAVVECDVVEVIENPRFLQFAQFGIDIAAAQRDDDGRIMRLDGLRDAEGGIDGAGEGHRNEDQIRLAAVNGNFGQILQGAIDQRRRCGEGSGHRLETGLTLCQRFGVANEFKARIDCLAQHIGNVVQVKGRQMPRPVLHAE